jgi:Protein of unknown function (DUF3551)
MRVALIGIVTVAAAFAIHIQSGSGEESFFNERYCTQGGSDRDNGGMPDCAFHTWQQCIESARGLGRYCAENPSWRGPRTAPTTQRKSSRRNR